MPRLNRRDLIASLGASATLLASRANAACDVWRDEVAGVPTKSYQCDLGNGRLLTSTFIRLSDVMFDSAASNLLPDPFGEYQELIRGHRLVDAPALNSFTQLFKKHSFPFEPENLSIAFDLREQNLSGAHERSGDGIDGRWRTLGVWDDTSAENLMMFPLPEELRRAMRDPGDLSGRECLRYAHRSDFDDLDEKIRSYTALWDAHPLANSDRPRFGNIHMLADIDAGSVPGFIPLLFSPFSIAGCDGTGEGGPTFVPPAAYVDVAVCRNDGTRSIEIEDMFGAADANDRLRAYDPATPSDTERFGWAPITLAPNESLLVLQRLLFGAEPVTVGNGDKEIVAQRAIFGPTHLPKGVIVDGSPVEFDGRSHNAVILASFANCCSCPYLESWCPRAGEWIEHGKILKACDGRERAGSETRYFPDTRTHFRLTEREHEETTITGARLTLTLRNGTSHIIFHPDASACISIGEGYELAFDIPAEIAACTVRSALTLSGHYEKFTQARFEERAAALTI